MKINSPCRRLNKPNPQVTSPRSAVLGARSWDYGDILLPVTKQDNSALAAPLTPPFFFLHTGPRAGPMRDYTTQSRPAVNDFRSLLSRRLKSNASFVTRQVSLQIIVRLLIRHLQAFSHNMPYHHWQWLQFKSFYLHVWATLKQLECVVISGFVT